MLLHPSFPPGTDRILRALGCPAEREAVAAACLAKTAQEIEDAVAAERGCAGVVRTPEEWDAFEQGRILASRPPVEVIKIGDSPPEPLPAEGDMPLSGVRVLDMTRVLAGPTCAARSPSTAPTCSISPRRTCRPPPASCPTPTTASSRPGSTSPSRADRTSCESC